MTSTAQALDVSVGAFVSELGRAGVRHVCACPGSRSTPLAIKLAQEPSIRLWMHLDERSAAYFGLGLARALREPVALLATSGTAAANFLPAVVEASLSRIPLVVLTADRPHELRDVGAPQTIDQLRLYGEHVRWFFDLPEPELSPEHIRFVRTIAGRAVGTSVAEPPGPVHLNWPFREPLMPESDGSATSTPTAWGARAQGRPYARVHTGRLAPLPDLTRQVAAEFADHPRGLIICGPQDDPLLSHAVARLAERVGYPILADPLSGVRCGVHDRSKVVDAYDAFLRDAQTVERLEPEIILRLGAMPTSKSLLLYLQRFAAARHLVVDPGGWREPTALASDVLHVDPRLLCEALADCAVSSPTTPWAATWSGANAVARGAMEQHLRGLEELSEPRLLSELAASVGDGTVLVAGNSMPVRDLDSFLPGSEKRVRCLSNRGANGIDGVVSTALGTSAARVGPVVLVIGDVSFYHDLNGLLAARKHGLDLLVVLVNNDGGGIFNFLPQATSTAMTEHYETLFGTPHGLDFRPFVEGYGGRFVRVEDWPGFRAAVADGLTRGGLHVVEVPTERTRNVIVHREVWRVVAAALAPAIAH
jgi:2-succinyl-5-enolpyruvyl-6-hydroxy-3-cyclohexene-1-carboxylate synthase